MVTRRHKPTDDVEKMIFKTRKVANVLHRELAYRKEAIKK